LITCEVAAGAEVVGEPDPVGSTVGSGAESVALLQAVRASDAARRAAGRVMRRGVILS
jgi:hypothetical protein